VAGQTRNQVLLFFSFLFAVRLSVADGKMQQDHAYRTLFERPWQCNNGLLSWTGSNRIAAKMHPSAKATLGSYSNSSPRWNCTVRTLAQGPCLQRHVSPAFTSGPGVTPTPQAHETLPGPRSLNLSTPFWSIFFLFPFTLLLFFSRREGSFARPSTGN
jgi:hypothetical protein